MSITRSYNSAADAFISEISISKLDQKARTYIYNSFAKATEQLTQKSEDHTLRLAWFKNGDADQKDIFLAHFLQEERQFVSQVYDRVAQAEEKTGRDGKREIIVTISP